jgi:hypothetical protein
LRAPLETALRRIHGRSGHLKEEVVRQMHAEFEIVLGKYARRIVETENQSVAEIAVAVARRREQGDFLLPLNTIAMEP